jgi:serine/threonine-protein kinase
MEHVRGERLGNWIDRGALSLRDALSIADQILGGLAALHDAGIVHGDVKSDNILVEARPDGTLSAKLIDLGLVGVYLQHEEGGANEPMISGTPDYMAPEVIRGQRATPSSDVYAVGVILYEMLTGATPFGGATVTEVVHRHLEDDAIPPSLRAPEAGIPPCLDRIVMRALAKHPSDRHASMVTMAAALRIAMPVVDGRASTRRTLRMPSTAPTLDWPRRVRQPERHRVARGTPRRH